MFTSAWTTKRIWLSWTGKMQPFVVGDSLTINQLYAFDTSYTDTEIICPLTWTSSDSDIVSIVESDDNHAVITANAPGTATVTATNSFNISDSVQITVVESDDEKLCNRNVRCR